MKSSIHILKQLERLAKFIMIRSNEYRYENDDGVKYEKEFDIKQSVPVCWSCNWGNCVVMVPAAAFGGGDT